MKKERGEQSHAKKERANKEYGNRGTSTLSQLATSSKRREKRLNLSPAHTRKAEGKQMRQAEGKQIPKVKKMLKRKKNPNGKKIPKGKKSPDGKKIPGKNPEGKNFDVLFNLIVSFKNRTFGFLDDQDLDDQQTCFPKI